MADPKKKALAAFYKAREEFLLALAQADVNPAGLRVGLVLATRFNRESWEADPSVKRLTDMTGTDRRTVQRGIASLRDAGIIDIKEGRGQGNRHTFRLLANANKRRQDCRLLEEDEKRQDRHLSDDEKAAILVAKGGNFGRERRQDCRPDTIETPFGTQGAAASSGGPPMATVSPTSTVVEDTQRDAQTGEEARFKSAPPPPSAADKNGKPKYPKDWSQGLSEEERRAELREASEAWQRLLDEGEDEKVIRAALWAYCKGIEEAARRGAGVSLVPPPSRWFRERWFERPEWWGLPVEAHRRSSTFHGG